MKINRIKPPKYKVGRYVLNEYELRNLMFDVCNGTKNIGIVVTDEKGISATIQSDGTLSNNLFGLDINSNFTLGIIRLNREKFN